MGQLLAARRGLTDAQSLAEIATLTEQIRVDTLAKSPTNFNAAKPLTSLDPRYAQQRQGEITPAYALDLGTTRVKDAAKQTTGWAATRNATTDKWKQPAVIRDRPSVGTPDVIDGMDFEVAALGQGPGVPTEFLGSVTWGWRMNRTGPKPRAETREIALADQQTASGAFQTAVQHFNQIQVPIPGGGGATVGVMQLP